MAKQSFVVKTTMDVGSVAAVLENFVQSFKDRTLRLQSGEEFVTLKPNGPINLEMEATVHKGKQKVTFELSWIEESVPGDGSILIITSKEPEPAPSAPERRQ